MVKVIKEGKIPEPNPKKSVCSNCKSILEYEQEDMGTADKKITCPFCKKRTFAIEMVSYYHRTSSRDG